MKKQLHHFYSYPYRSLIGAAFVYLSVNLSLILLSALLDNEGQFSQDEYHRIMLNGHKAVAEVIVVSEKENFFVGEQKAVMIEFRTTENQNGVFLTSPYSRSPTPAVGQSLDAYCLDGDCVLNGLSPLDFPFFGFLAMLLIFIAVTVSCLYKPFLARLNDKLVNSKGALYRASLVRIVPITVIPFTWKYEICEVFYEFQYQGTKHRVKERINSYSNWEYNFQGHDRMSVLVHKNKSLIKTLPNKS